MTKLKTDNKRLEERIRVLERINKESNASYTYLINECSKMNEKNKQFDKLVNYLTSVLAYQSYTGYKEISGTDSFKNETVSNVLIESLKSLGNYLNGFDSSILRKKTIMNIPYDTEKHSNDVRFLDAPLSLVDSLDSPDPGMTVDPLPNDFTHDRTKLTHYTPDTNTSPYNQMPLRE